MMIQQTVIVPEDRRIYVDLPENTPTGNAEVTLRIKTVHSPAPRLVDWILHPLRRYREARFQSAVTRAAEKLAGVFEDDGVVLQRRWRDD